MPDLNSAGSAVQPYMFELTKGTEGRFADAKGLSEAMNRRTYNTMTKRKKHTR